MKTLNAFLMLLFVCSRAIGGIDSVFVTIQGDTVTIWNTAAHDNCAARYIFEVTTVNDTITVKERDTASVQAFCRCYFDLSVSLTGLDAGTYRVNVYRYPWHEDTTVFIGSASFTLGDRSSSSSAIIPFQSECGGIVAVEKEKQSLPSEIALLVNYPNPFNPITTIKYSIPTSEFVTLKVFNLLGIEVATLASEQKPAGSYEIHFDAAKFPSGVYFYRLSAGNTTLVKKMMLIR